MNLTHPEDFDDDWDRPQPKFWRCQECGHEDHSKAMPADREKFYAKIQKSESPRCPSCKSVGFMPVGF